MTYKQQIVEALAVEIRQILQGRYLVETRSDHGCWEVVVRRHTSREKAVECTLTSEVGFHPKGDELYITYNQVYDNTRTEVLSDPTWIDRFLNEIREGASFDVGSQKEVREDVGGREFQGA